MVNAGQQVGQERDAAEATVPVFATPVRREGERAILVSERSAVWDRPSVAAMVERDRQGEEMFEVGALGPMPTTWTGELVHCRLTSVDALCRQLPRVSVPATYRSFLGALQPQEAGVLRKPISAEDADRIDWTLARVFNWPEDDRAVLMGFMSGRSMRKVAKIVQHLKTQYGIGRGGNKTTVAKRYRALTAQMADEWNRSDVPIDRGTREAWLAASTRGR